MRFKRLGFSLVELMVVLTVAGIALAIGVPSFNQFVRNAKLTKGVNGVVAAVHLSRSEASKRGVPVVMCTSTSAMKLNAEACDTSEGVSWKDGWIVFADVNATGSFDGVDVIIQRQGVQHEKLRVISHEQIATSITYLPNGFAQLPLITESGRYIVYCDDTNEDRYSRILSLSNSGRPSIVPRENASAAPSCALGN